MEHSVDQPAGERRSYAFAMRLNARERRLLQALAAYLERSRSDVVRLLVREAAQMAGIESVTGGAADAEQEAPRG